MVHMAEQKVLFFAHFYAFRSDDFLGLRRIWEDNIANGMSCGARSRSKTGFSGAFSMLLGCDFF